jgi:tetratricopeptide (TPR) repeat protein
LAARLNNISSAGNSIVAPLLNTTKSDPSFASHDLCTTMTSLANLRDDAKRHHQARNWSAAEKCHRQMLALTPDDPAMHYNLAVVLMAQKRSAAAIECYRRALELRPDFYEAIYNLGVVLAENGEHEAALECYRRVTALQPRFFGGHNNLFQILRERGRFEEALASCHQALQWCPETLEAWVNLGQILGKLDRWKEAAEALRRALPIQPDDARTLNLLGVAEANQDRTAEAVALFQEALRCKPNYPEAQFNLGNCLRDQGKPAEAIGAYEAALALRPDYAEPHFNRCLLRLLSGDYERGWPEWHWRWRCADTPARPFRRPFWDGADLKGRTILLHDDQGLGDFIQLIRFAPLVKQRGGVVLVECPPGLTRLLQSAEGIDVLIPGGDPLPDFAVHAGLFTLPGILGTTLDTIPVKMPYLTADPVDSELWRRRWVRPGEFRVGIVWQGNPTYRKDRHRSASLSFFAPLARVPGVRLFSLQKGPKAAEIGSVDFPVTDLGSGFADFADTAAAVTNLDLVIGTCTSVIHCAGALAVPTWVALGSAAVNDWRWLLERDDSPWYPSVRLFRQRQPGAWHDVFERITNELGVVARSAPRRGSAATLP